jgi:hypothetical protein
VNRPAIPDRNSGSEPGDAPNPARRAAIVARIRQEILRDVATGVLPGMSATFSELHDYVDANAYGGLCDVHADIDTDELITIQNGVEAWLIQEAIRVIEARLADQP